MTVIFELWAECEDESGLQKLKEHFHDEHYTLLSGRVVRFRAAIEDESVRGLSVWSFDICPNLRGIETLQDTLDATEAGVFLYHRLMSAPSFRFAHVDFEAHHTTSEYLSESVYTMNNGQNWVTLQCVISDKFHNELGAPVSFKNFCEGYKWQEYRGETYDPLFSSDQRELNEKCRNLLPFGFEPNKKYWW